MSIQTDILKLRITMCFLNSSCDNCTVAGISRTLGEEKYKVSRVMIQMENEGLLDRSDIRRPKLTEKGIKEGEIYKDRIELTQKHLMYEGMDMEKARKDSRFMALYCSEDFMNVLRLTDELYSVKNQLKSEQHFTGGVLTQRFHDGEYKFPFVVYKESVYDNNNISRANEAFMHPCVLKIKNGKGLIKLYSVPVVKKVNGYDKVLRGKLESLEYFEFGRFVNAERDGNIISFPVDDMRFTNLMSGTGSIFHGNICLRMEYSINGVKREKEKVIFTVLM